MKVGLGILTAFLLATCGLLAGQETTGTNTEQEASTFGYWMEVKLKESQSILASLARADYEAIKASAEKLKTTSLLEGFVRRGSKGYRTQLRAFEFAVDEIAAQAKDKNLEGVALGYQQLTLSCVHCHKQIRQATADAPR